MDVAATLRSAILAALPGFLLERLGGLGVVVEATDVETVVDRTAGELQVLLDLPFDRQPETPLEVVRRSIGPLGEGIEAGIGPASAAELGADVLEASLAWGLAKTAALTRPTLLVVTSNLMDASRFEAAATAAGHRVESGRGATASVTPLVAFVDLEVDGADDAIRSLAADGVRVVAYGPHVDDHALVRAMALGAAAAEPRSRMFRNPGAYLRPLV